MKPRRMTEADYAEAGVGVPEHMVESEHDFPCPVGACQRHRTCMYLNHPRCGVHLRAEVERCDDCGDEQGECGCSD